MNSEDVFGKADALMRRRSFVAGGAQYAPPPEDVPVLTEVVDPGQAQAALAASPCGSSAAQNVAVRMHELLEPLPPDIARAVENWLAATLPHLLARRLDTMAEQIAGEVGAALRESLPLLIADLIRAAQERTRSGP